VVGDAHPTWLGSAVIGHLGPGVRAADDGAKSNQQHIVKQVACVVMPGVFDAIEMFFKMILRRIGLTGAAAQKFEGLLSN
jgi:hypothetical protein